MSDIQDRPGMGGIAATVMVFAACLLFLAGLGDRNGFEGDDLNSVVPMLDLDAARAGLISIYRYDWQVLSYQLGAVLATFTQDLWPVFLLPAIGMAAGLALQYRILSRNLGVPALAVFCIFLLSPELFYTGLYYNSTALGYPFAVAALALVLAPPGPGRSVLVGGLLGLAFLFRLDFVLIAPAMLLLYWFRTGRLLFPAIAGAVLGAIGIAVLATGIVSLANLMEIYRFHSAEIAAMSDAGGWNDHTKMFVASTILSPLGFVYYGLGSVWLLWGATGRERRQGLLVLLALAPSFMSLRDILSVKYMIPAYVFLPLLGGLIWHRLRNRLGGGIRIATATLAAATAFLLVASVDIDNQRPFVKLSVWVSRAIPTHDGLRSWGAYFPRMLHVGILPQVGGALDTRNVYGAQLAAAIAGGQAPLVAFIGEDNAFGLGGIGWRHAVISLLAEGFRAEVVAEGVMVVRGGDRQLWLARRVADLPPAILENPEMRLLEADDPDLVKRIAEMADDGAD